MGQKFKNNAYGTLSAGIISGDGTINLTAGHGARFPSLAAGDYFDATLIDTSNNLEIIRVTARSTDQLTALRGQDGTSARAYSAGDRIELRWCASAVASAQQEAVKALALSGTDTYTGSLSPVPTGYNSDQAYFVRFPNTNTVSNPTVNLNSLGAKTIKNPDGSALAIGQLKTGIVYPLHFDGTDMLLIEPQVLKGKTLVNPANLDQTLTDGATVNWDMNLGHIASLTLGGNRTMAAPTNLKKGVYILHVIQDGTGSRTITWNAVFKWPGATAPVLSTTAARRDILSFVCDGTNLYGSFLPDVR
jgi:hypothetical protein